MRFANGVNVRWSDVDRKWLVRWHDDVLERHEEKDAAVRRAVVLERSPDALFTAMQKLHERDRARRRRR